jgi:hypothetical protein
MAGNLQWSATLKDGMSAPAHVMAGALSAMSAKLRTAGAEAEAFQRKQEAAMRANVGRDAIAKLQGKQKGEESGARTDLLANMKHHDTIAAEAAALAKTKVAADAAAQAMQRYAKATAAAATAGSKLASRSVMGKTAANEPGGLFGKTEGAKTGLGKIAQAAGSMFGDKGASAVLGIASAIEKIAPAAAKVLGPLKAIGSTIFSVLGSVISVAAQVGAALAGIAVAGGLALAKYVVEMQSFKSSTMFAFGQILGGQTQAAAGWEKVRSAAIMTGTSLTETGASFNMLLAQGFSLDAADALFKRMADIKTLNPGANIESMSRNIAKIKTQGWLQGDEIQGLSEAGLNSQFVYEELGKKLGKTTQEVKKLQAAGKIKSTDALDAIEKAMARQSGGKPAGKVADEAASTTIAGGTGRLLARVQDFASGLKISFAPLAGFLDRVGKVLQGEGGAKLGASIENAFAKVLGMFDKMSEKDISTAFAVAAGIIDTMAAAVGRVAGAIATVDGWMTSLNAKTSAWGAIFAGLGGALAGIGDVLLTAIGGPLVGVLKESYDWCVLLWNALMRVARATGLLGEASSTLALPGVSNAAGGGALSDAFGKKPGEDAPAGSASTPSGGLRPQGPSPSPPGGPTMPLAAPPPANKTSTKTYNFTATGITDAQFVERVKAIIREEDAAGGDDD